MRTPKLLLSTLLIACSFSANAKADEVSFRKDIAPILLNRCVACHNDAEQEGGYNVSNFTHLQEVGDSGEVPITAGKPKNSELLRRLLTDDEDERMPAESDALPATEITLVRKWIELGAKFDAEDPSASLSSILPVTKHRTAPIVYPFPISIAAIANLEEQMLVSGYHELLRVEPTGKLIQRIPQVGERIYDIAIDRERDRVYVASGSPGKLGEVRILNATTGELVGVPIVSNEVMLKLAMDPKRETLAVAGGDRKLYLLDLRTNSIARTYDSHSDWVRSVCWSDDGSRIVTASRDKTVKLFDPSSDRPLDTYSEHGEDVIDVTFVPSKTDEFVSCDTSGKVHRWKLNNKKKPHKVSLKATRAYALGSAKDGFWISASSGFRAQSKFSVTKFDWAGKKELAAHELPSPGISITSPIVRVGMLNGKVWQLNPKGVIRVLPREKREL